MTDSPIEGRQFAVLSARRSDTPTRATARARKEPAGRLPIWLMSDSQ